MFSLAADIIALITSRSFIISLAILGAVIATVGSYLMRDESRMLPRHARMITRSGYAITWASVAGFIVVGFIAE